MLLELLKTLNEHGVEYILIGGAAATLHGSARLTQDIDVVYRRTRENIARLVQALAPYHPYPRGAPAGLPFQWDEQTLWRGLNFTLETRLGYLDLWGEVAGGGNYETLQAHTVEAELQDMRVRVVDLETLIRLKRAAGRPKDYEAIAELESLRALQEEQTE